MPKKSTLYWRRPALLGAFKRNIPCILRWSETGVLIITKTQRLNVQIGPKTLVSKGRKRTFGILTDTTFEYRFVASTDEEYEHWHRLVRDIVDDHQS